MKKAVLLLTILLFTTDARAGESLLRGGLDIGMATSSSKEEATLTPSGGLSGTLFGSRVRYLGLGIGIRGTVRSKPDTDVILYTPVQLFIICVEHDCTAGGFAFSVLPYKSLLTRDRGVVAGFSFVMWKKHFKI